MVVMALDHVRDHLHASGFFFDPADLTKTTPALFFTRWITHFCAPGFMFLAGVGTFLWGARRQPNWTGGAGRTPAEISRYLVTRGLWLVLLELTLIQAEWNMGIELGHFNAFVIWALGWSMIALAALVWLPLPAIASFGIWMVLLHDLFDRVKPEALGPLAWLWTILHVQGNVALPGGRSLFVMYPLIPWIGVMAAGYAFGAWLVREDPRRRRRMIVVGALMVAMFVELRLYNVYGDPHPWSRQKDALFSLLSFVNCAKYPPSLLFLLMTLGPLIALVAVMDRGVPRWLRPIVVYGRVPLFYYILHLALIDLVTVGFTIARYRDRLPQVMAKGFPPPDWGWSLAATYAAWIAIVAALYPLCRWYAELKARRRAPWMSWL